MMGIKRANAPAECSGYCLGCDLDCTWAFNKVPVPPAPVQSVEEHLLGVVETRLSFYRAYEGQEYARIEKRKEIALELIEKIGASQRQAGREEALVEMADNAVRLKKHYDDALAVIDARYAALEEAAREARNDTECFGDFVDGDGNSMQCWEVANITEKEMCSWCRLDKALHDLDESKGAPHA